MLALMIPQLRPQGSLPFILAVALVSSGCKAPQPFGDRHSLIVRADSALWLSVDSSFITALEQRVFTTRSERRFKLTFVEASDTLWRNFRLWEQVVVLGASHDEVTRRVLRASDDPNASPPAIVQAKDIWARGQAVTLMLLPDQDADVAVIGLLPDLYALLEEQYKDWVVQRMYVSGVNDSLIEALAGVGFTLELPKVYGHYQEDSAFRFRNAYPDPGTLLRSVLVSWETGLDPVDLDALREWREQIDETRYDPPHNILDDHLRFDTVSFGELDAVELRGVWQDRSDFPAAGPFITRAMSCATQDRTYFIDAWLYAPGTDKYPYVRQLEVLLDSFRCAGTLRADRTSTGERLRPATR